MNHPLDSTTQFASTVSELVRERELEFLNELRPLVVRQNVTLDLEDTQRIDAAGLTALITLYCEARDSGHWFAVAHPSPRVREVLRLVGLDVLLVAESDEENACYRPRLQATAA